MLGLLLGLIIAVIFSFFALQNSQLVTVRLSQYALTLPVYLLSAASIIIGILLSLIVNISDSISSSAQMFGKDQKIRNAQRTLDDMETKIKDLEIENARLKVTGPTPDFIRHSPFKRPNFFQRLRQRISF